MYNTGRLVVFVGVLGKGLKGAFFMECEAAFLRLPLHVVNKIWQRGRYGSERYGCKKHILTQQITKGALRCTTPAIDGIGSCPGRRRGGGVLDRV